MYLFSSQLYLQQQHNFYYLYIFIICVSSCWEMCGTMNAEVKGQLYESVLSSQLHEDPGIKVKSSDLYGNRLCLLSFITGLNSTSSDAWQITKCLKGSKQVFLKQLAFIRRNTEIFALAEKTKSVTLKVPFPF